MAKRIDTEARIEAIRFQNQRNIALTQSGILSVQHAFQSQIAEAVTDAGISRYPLLFFREDELFFQGSNGNVKSSSRTLIAEKKPSGTGTVTFPNIPGIYNKLVIELAIRSTQAAVNVNGLIQFNADATDANYQWAETESHAAGTTGGNGSTTRTFTTGICGANATANSFTIGKIEIVQYANPNFFKQAKYWGSHLRDTSSIYEVNYSASTVWKNTAAITQIDIVLSAGNFASNSILRLIGEM